MKRFTILFLIATATAVNACSNDVGRTSPFVPTHVAELAGVAKTNAGAPLDSVRVAVAPLTERQGAFGSAAATTGSAGTFRLLFERFDPHVSASQADTVRVVITAQALKRSFAGQSGQPATRKDTVLLTLLPYGQTPIVETISFAFAPP